MRQDIGLSTITQRLAGLRQGVPAQPSAPPAGSPSFADALSAQVGGPAQAGQPGGAVPFGQPGAGQPGFGQPEFGQPSLGQPGAGQAAFQAAPVLLGQGTRLNPAGALFSPASPGAVSGVGAPAVGHSCPDCSPMAAAGGIVAPVSTGGALGARRSGPPPELQAYGNGRIPPTALEPLGTGDHMLWSPAARAFRDLSAAAARDGVSFGVNSSYRSYEGQVAMVERYGLYSQGGRAAQPGTSNHGWGVSVDLQLDDRAQAWMRANGATYGFVEDVAREPWHWTFTASGY